MKGDFTRFPFDPSKHYSGVRKQQGRVDLDADWNEAADIEDYLDALQSRDVIGDSAADDTHVNRGDKFGDLQEIVEHDIALQEPIRKHFFGLRFFESLDDLSVRDFHDGLLRGQLQANQLVCIRIDKK